MSKEIIVVASGYFEPMVHYGHIDYLTKARQLGDKLIVIVNNDRQSVLKKGICIIPVNQRIKMIRELRCVDFVIESVDEDRTVCKTLSILHPDIFAKGGDQTINTIPEAEVCKQLGIKIVDGLGDKIQSSRYLLADFKDKVDKIDKKYLHDEV
ncbi:MAG TPA: adenylyltransferase/cytidyltransferase family protein [Candidatus Saccharimonadales bacterium]|nr:adenylyltransferase/cytidyltransferase family protein [Candidatus Saccharimonadales bacterium]